ASCSFGDPSGQVLTISVVSHAVAGVSFTVNASHSVPVTIMQVTGASPSIPIAAAASAVARAKGTKGAAIQTLSPAGCGGSAGNSITFTGSSTTTVSGDIWSNGSITDNGIASGSVDGDVTDICPPVPPSALPNFSVTGSQVNGWNMPDPGFAQPALDTTSRSWSSASG